MKAVEDRAGLTPTATAAPRGAAPSREQRERFQHELAAAGRTGGRAEPPAERKAEARQPAKPDGEGPRQTSGREERTDVRPATHAFVSRVGARGEGGKGGRGSGERDGEDAPAGATSLAGPAAARVAELAPPPAAASVLDPKQVAQLERMAAAIAEARVGADAALRIEFPAADGSALAAGAVLARDAATGALSIRVVGLNPAVGDARRTALEADLRERLDRRRIRVTHLAFERAGGPRAG